MEPPGGESSMSATATYTRRLRNRTEAGVERLSHHPQVKLSRREYSSRTEAGQPRGFTGKIRNVQRTCALRTTSLPGLGGELDINPGE